MLRLKGKGLQQAYLDTYTRAHAYLDLHVAMPLTLRCNQARGFLSRARLNILKAVLLWIQVFWDEITWRPLNTHPYRCCEVLQRSYEDTRTLQKASVYRPTSEVAEHKHFLPKN